MRHKLQLMMAAATVAMAPTARGALPSVEGRITVRDKDEKPGDDVGQSVAWLSATAARPVAPVEAQMGTEKKEFSPHVLVIPTGSTVSFPNHDPFNHNVFSLSEEAPFDLGLYSRGEARSVRFLRPGVVRVYCNVHAQMSAIVLVRDNPWFTQPASDGSFTIAPVPPGRYVLHVWHERAPEVTRALDVPASGITGLAIELDARGYRFMPHLNKERKPYPQQGRRY